MQRQGINIPHLVGHDLDLDGGGFPVIEDDSEVLAKEFSGVELRGHLQGFLLGKDILHPLIQGIDPERFIPIAPSQHIPALFEKLQTIRVQDERCRLAPPETLVGNFDGLLVAHGVHDDRKPFLAGRDLLEEDPVAHVRTLVHQVVHGKGLQQPLTDTVSLQVIGVSNVVPQGAVALDFNSKSVKNGFPVIVESPFVQLLSRIVER